VIRKAMLGLAWLGLCALVFEISLRGLAAVEIGRSAWLYGWSPDRDQRSVSALRQATRRTNATLVVANQQAKSTLHDRESIRGVRYADEVREIRDLLAQRGFLYAPEALLLVHAELMDGEARWSAAHEVPFVDLIHALDQRRDVLVSWVHLLPEGNRIIADELAAPILARACPTHH